MKLKKTFLIISLGPVLLLILDRWLKYLAQISVSADGIALFGDLIKFKLFFNSGLAFGVQLNYYLILFFYFVFIFLLLWQWLASYLKDQKAIGLMWWLVILGAFSNLWDRLILGQVIDYLDVKFYSVFNLADVMIVCGVVGLLVLLAGKKEKRD
ncbi:MAG: signal peptidase II [Patescibacteria group bacterium]